MSNAMDELAALTADLRAWLSWQEMLGSQALPRESVPPLPEVEAQPVSRSPMPSKMSGNRQVVRKSPPPAPQAPVKPQPVEPTVTKQPAATGRPLLSDKWKVLMESPTTHQVTGPSDARLTIVRGSGSSADAESMLERMLENVVGVKRADVRVIDLIRDTRAPNEIGQGFRAALSELKPELMLVMGTYAVRALYGEEHAVTDVRGAWTDLAYEGGTVALRVTHHPEAILALAARGQSAPKREAFEDLKALGQRLTSA